MPLGMIVSQRPDDLLVPCGNLWFLNPSRGCLRKLQDGDNTEHPHEDICLFNQSSRPREHLFPRILLPATVQVSPMFVLSTVSTRKHDVTLFVQKTEIFHFNCFLCDTFRQVPASPQLSSSQHLSPAVHLITTVKVRQQKANQFERLTNLMLYLSPPPPKLESPLCSFQRASIITYSWVSGKLAT